jgi:putative ABC transport system ATP-binding protein
VDGSWSDAATVDVSARERLIALDKVSKSYRRGRQDVPVLSGLSMSVARGDFAAITGPSGSGKTTLLNLLGGLDKPCSGQVNFDGVGIERLSQGQLSAWRAANVGFIFQFCNLMPTLSAVANVELPLLLTPMSARERRRRALTALDIVGLSDRAAHKPRELSGGQQQRVAIARAVIADPKLILADEPTGDLDRASSIDVLEMLRLLNREFKKTIVMVTHDPVAAGYADYELRFDKGVAEGTLP